MGEIVNFPPKTDTPGFIEDLWLQLEIYERKIEDIKRTLGILAVREDGLDI